LKATKEYEKIINKVHSLAIKDVYKGLDPEWRWNSLKSISYWKIIYSFKPITSFFKDHKCLKERSVLNN
jgi:hypothetical protein